MMVSRSGLPNGSGASSTESTTLKMAVLAPIPSARVRIAVTVNAGRFSRVRPAKRRSCRRVSMGVALFLSTRPYAPGRQGVSGLLPAISGVQLLVPLQHLDELPDPLRAGLGLLGGLDPEQDGVPVLAV